MRTGTTHAPKKKNAAWRALGEQYVCRHDADRGYIYLGTINQKFVALLTPHPKGLRLYLRDRRKNAAARKSRSIIIPGEYLKSDVVDFLVKMTGVNAGVTRSTKDVLSRTTRDWRSKGVYSTTVAVVLRRKDIALALDESGFWKQRGFLAWPVPRAFFRAVKLNDFVRGATPSLRAWWTRWIANEYLPGVVRPVRYAPPGSSLAIESEAYAAAVADVASAKTRAAAAEDDLHVACRPLYDKMATWRGRCSAASSSLTRAFAERRLAALEREIAQRQAMYDAMIASLAPQHARDSQRVALTRYRLAKAMIAGGHLVESPTTVRGWTHLAAPHFGAFTKRSSFLKDVLHATNKGWHRHAKWGIYTSQLHSLYRETIFVKHPTWITDADDFGRIVDCLLRLPRTTATVEDVDRLINAGLTTNTFLALLLRSGRELRFAATLASQLRGDRYPGRQSTPGLSSQYRPPQIALPDGWQFADHRSFPLLSDMFSCCISNAPFYVRNIALGYAHVAFRPDRKALAYFEFIAYPTRSGHWKVSEIRGYGNAEPSAKALAAAEEIAETLTRVQPIRSPQVELVVSKRDDGIAAIVAAARAPRDREIAAVIGRLFGYQEVDDVAA